nr:MAG TPA: hypothetical protein [Caudoviricetes sp.]
MHKFNKLSDTYLSLSPISANSSLQWLIFD